VTEAKKSYLQMVTGILWLIYIKTLNFMYVHMKYGTVWSRSK